MTTETFKSRRISLVVAGFLYLGMAGLLLLAAAGMLAAGFIQNGNPQEALRPEQMRAAAITPALIGVVFGILGVGTILCRRWARALTVVGAWFGIIMGITALSFLTIQFLAGTELPNTQGASTMPLGSRAIMSIVLGISLVLYVALPGLFLVLCSGRNAKLTCEDRNPAPAWTDKVPLPVLGAILMMAFSGFASTASRFMYNPVFPFFGSLLTGNAAFACMLGIGAMYLYFAYGMYRLEKRALNLAILTILVWSISSFITFQNVDIVQLYRAMGMTEEQIKMTVSSPFASISTSYTALFSIPWIVYLVWIRRFFKPATGL